MTVKHECQSTLNMQWLLQRPHEWQVNEKSDTLQPLEKLNLNRWWATLAWEYVSHMCAWHEQLPKDKLVEVQNCWSKHHNNANSNGKPALWLAPGPQASEFKQASSSKRVRVGKITVQITYDALSTLVAPACVDQVFAGILTASHCYPMTGTFSTCATMSKSWVSFC